MKRGLLVLLMMACGMMVKAGGPIKFELGLVAMPTNTWILNKDYKDKFDMTPQFTISFDYGFSAGVYFTERVGSEIDVLIGKYKQDFKSEDGFESTMEVSKTDIPVLFKLGKLMYLEAGFQFSLINKVERTVDGFGSADISASYRETQNFVVLGTGVSVGILDKIDISGGLRLGYGIEDFNSDAPEPFYDDIGQEIGAISSTTRAFAGLKIMAVYKF